MDDFNSDEFILTGNSLNDTGGLFNNSFSTNLIGNDGKQVTATEGELDKEFESDDFS